MGQRKAPHKSRHSRGVLWTVKLITEFINMQRETWLLWAPPQLPATPCTPLVGELFSHGPAAPSVAQRMCELRGGDQWCCVGVADLRVRACVHRRYVMGTSRRADDVRTGECRVHKSGRVCNGVGGRNYSTRSSSLSSLALWGGCGGGCSRQIYAPLGAEAAFAE